ncbi:MAG: hypothetical protein WCO68_08935 [Verrucomicrobiota bacterium]
MSTITEIEDAIEHLPVAEREFLESRLLARRFGLDTLNPEDRRQFLVSLDEAEREIDAGGGLSADELRQKLRSWVGR